MHVMNRFVAYGALLDSDLNLSPYLLSAEGFEPRLQLRVERFRGNGELLPLEQPFSSHGRRLILGSQLDLSCAGPEQRFCFEIERVVRFRWDSGDMALTYEPLAEYTETLAAFWLIHIALPLYFTLELHYVTIHACAVDVGGSTILFIAPSKGGKSTLADCFLKNGHGLVSDDKVATYFENETLFVVPSHPNHRPFRKFETLGNRVESFDAQAR